MIRAMLRLWGDANERLNANDASTLCGCGEEKAPGQAFCGNCSGW